MRLLPGNPNAQGLFLPCKVTYDHSAEKIMQARCLSHVNRCLRIAATMLVLAATWSANDCLAGAYFHKALQLIQQSQLPEARRALRTELRIHPRNIEARYDLAVLLEDIGHHHAARALYEKNLSFSWHLPSLINLAALLDRQGKRQQARHWLKLGTKKMRSEATPWYLLAAMSEKEGDSAAAATQYQKAVKVDRKNGFAWLRLAEFQSRHKLADRGVSAAEKALRLLPDCAPCWRSYGDIMQATNHNQKALSAYQRSLAIHPDARTRQQLIRQLRRLGQRQRARRMQQALNAWRKHHLTTDQQ